MLLEMIITLKLKPGEVVAEKDLIEKTGMGRTPIREALLLLKQDNFVERNPHKSTYVKEVGLNDIKDLFEALVVFEKNVTLIAMARITAAELAEIEKACNRVDAAIKDLDQWQISSENIHFHNLIYRASKNKFLILPAEKIRKHAERLSHLSYRGIDEPYTAEIRKHNKAVSKQHREIVRCLKDKDEKRLEVVTVGHIKYFREAVLNYMQSS